MVDTRGILRPAEVGRVFHLARPSIAAPLRWLVSSHWAVTWDLPAGERFPSEVLTHPAIHVVVEDDGVWAYGVRLELDVRVLSGKGFAVGSRLRPGAFGALGAGPAQALTDRRVRAADVFGAEGERLARRAAEAGDTAGRVAALEAFFMQRMRPPDPDGRLVQAVVDDIAGLPPGTTVAELAARHGVSTRTLQRLFAHHVGVGPKWVLRRLRLHDALEGTQRGADADWARFALDLGYFDQAHFVRDFRAVVGRTPTEYSRQVSRGT